MSNLSINGYDRGNATLYELKSNVSIEQAKEKGQNDKLDQIYFKSEGKNFVLQGESINFSAGFTRPALLPPNPIKLENKTVELILDGKKVKAVIASEQIKNEEVEIKVGNKVFKGEIIDIDNEVNSKSESFAKGINSKTSDTTAKVITATAGALALVALGKTDSFACAFSVVVLGAFTIGAVGGGFGLHGIYKNSQTKPNYEQLKGLLQN
ncbi:MAG: hypothetical protein ACK4IX_03995 [Candidatus Sericytochromatia bacterium]